MSEPALRARGLGKRFGRSVALAGIDLELAQGASLAVLGPNGAGKSTLLRLIAGLGAPDRRHAHVARRGGRRIAPRARARRLHRARVAALPLAHRAREPVVRCAPAAGRRRGARASSSCSSSPGSRASRICRRRLLARHGAAPRDRARAGPRPAAVAARRAVHRTRSARGGAARRASPRSRCRPHARARDARSAARGALSATARSCWPPGASASTARRRARRRTRSSAPCCAGAAARRAHERRCSRSSGRIS